MTPVGIGRAVVAATTLATAACAGRNEHRNATCRAVEIIVGFGIGGGTDLFARNLAIGLSEELGTPVQVINITGGGGVGGFREVVNRPADGCTLLALTSDYVVLAALQPDDVDLDRLVPLARAHTELGLLSTGTGGAESWEALVANASAAGRRLLIGGIGARSFDRTAVDLTLAAAGVAYRYIPYSGAKEMQADLFGGRLDAVYDELGVMQPIYEAGEARPLMTFSEREVDYLPGTPSAKSLGLGVAPPIWRGIAIPADAPADKSTRYASAIQRAMQTDAYTAYEQRRRLDLMRGTLDAAGFKDALARDRIQFGAVLRR